VKENTAPAPYTLDQRQPALLEGRMSARKLTKPALRLLPFPVGPRQPAGSTRAKGDPTAPVCEAARALCEISPSSFAFMADLMFTMLSVYDAGQAAALRRAQQRVAGGER